MPSLIHHTANWLSRPRVAAANGTPLSVRILLGSPYCLNSLLNTSWVGSSSVPSSPWHASR